MKETLPQLWPKIRPELRELLINVAEDPTYKSKYFAMGYIKALHNHQNLELGETTCFRKMLEQLDDETAREQCLTLYGPKDE